MPISWPAPRRLSASKTNGATSRGRPKTDDGRPMNRNIESYIGSLLVLGALMLFLSGMVFRLLSLPLSGGWVAEVSIYMVAWGLLMSAAGCVASGEHVRADFFLQKVSPEKRHLADILAAAAGLAFCLALAWFGYKVVAFAFALFGAATAARSTTPL